MKYFFNKYYLSSSILGSSLYGMNNKNTENDKFKINLNNNKKILLIDIKSSYILKKICSCLNKKNKLNIIKHNKKLQYKLNFTIDDYKKLYDEYFSPIEIELIIKKNTEGNFINIENNNISFYHIFFDDNNQELKKNYITNENLDINKIKIIIDHQIKSFRGLFKDCKCIKYINFINFKRIDIKDMSYMFYNCKSLQELDLNNYNTSNVFDMSYMFYNCQNLKELYLYNFNTQNVNNMSYMFYNCYFLKKLDLNNFNTQNVIYMDYMFYNCKNLKNLYLYNFNTQNVNSMCYMFYKCLSLKTLDLSNFNTKNVTNMDNIFDNSKIKFLKLFKIYMKNFNVYKGIINRCFINKIEFNNNNYMKDNFDFLWIKKPVFY